MTALSDRVEAASVDEQRAMLKEAYHAIFPHNSPQHDHQHRARFIGLLDAEAYLDAAMMLVPEGSWFLIKNVMGPQPMTRDLFVADVLVAGGKDRPIQLTRPFATPTLALTAACLRARGL